MKTFRLFFCVLIFNSLISLAQTVYHPTMISVGKQRFRAEPTGNISLLRNAKVVNILYDYRYIKVDGFATEQDYIKNRQEKYYEKGDPEAAERFAAKWYSSRKESCEPNFEKLFNKYCTRFSGQNYGTGNEITMIVAPLLFEPGFYGPATKATYLSFSVVFLDRNNTEFFRYILTGVPGYNVPSCFNQAAKNLSKVLLKDLR